jgi:hypothetical protein
MNDLFRRRPALWAITLAAIIAGCASPYVARTGPLTPCDTSAGPFNTNAPRGVCNWQLNRYQMLLFRMGYVREPDVHSTQVSIHRWSRRWADTSDVLTVEFAHSSEPAASSDLYGGRYVLRINVSGQTFVTSAGRRRHVHDSASLTRDADYLAAQLHEMFRRTARRG